ncbi:MAG TPA: prohibitin family protein, partial [Campylobacterales bacterium]|nr:prohibitin family protein [Campylobacterales bacterium]
DNSGGNKPPRFTRPSNNDGGGSGRAAPSWIIVVIAIVGLLVFLKPFTIINSGEVGIKVQTGKFDEKPLDAGLHFYVPVLQKIITVNTKIKQIIYSNEANVIQSNEYNRLNNIEDTGLIYNKAIPVLDKRGLTVHIDLAVQYQLRPETAPETIKQWGLHTWEEKIINSKVREVVRDVIGKYAAEKLPEMRNEIATAIQTKVTEKVESLNGKPVVLSAIELRNIVLPPKIKAKIEEVQAAKQDVTIAEQQKEKAKQEAQRKAEIARGEAERNRIEAQGQADKIRIEAEEQAKANQLISESLTPRLIELEQIKTQAKFNDALKVNKDAQIFLTPGGSVPNIWVDAKSKQQKVSTQQ